MSYTKHNFKYGDVLEAEDLNAIEDGIVQNETDIAAINGNVATVSQAITYIYGES